MHKGFGNFQIQILQESLMNRHVIAELQKFFVRFVVSIIKPPPQVYYDEFQRFNQLMFSSQTFISKGAYLNW